MWERWKIKLDRILETKMFLIILVMFFVSFAFRFYIADFSKVLVVEPDEIRYIKWANTFYKEKKISLNGITRLNMPLLYSIVISIAYCVSDKLMQISIITFINCIAVCSTIIPAYLLAKKWISSKKYQFAVLFIVILIPDMAISMTFMAENIFIPLCVWLFYFIDRYFSLEKGQIRDSVWLAFWCILLYSAKEVSLYFVLSIVAVSIVKCVIERKHMKHYIFQIFVFIVSFLLFYWIYKYNIVKYLLIDSSRLQSGGGLELKWKINSLYDFLFYIYLNMFANMNTFVAFFYFPIAVPILFYNVLDKKDKLRVVFALITQIIAIGVITYLTSFVEHYGELDVWQNMRYYSPLLIWDLLLMFRILEKYKREDYQRISREWIIGFSVFAVMVIFNLFRLFKGGFIENFLMKFYSFMGTDPIRINDNVGKFSISYREILIKIFIILFIGILTYYLFYKQKCHMYLCTFMIGAFIICILNNICTIKEVKSTYSLYYNKEKLDEIILMNDYFSNKKDINILLATDGFDKMLNTYFEEKGFWVFEDDILDNYLNEGKIDFLKNSILCQYPRNNYFDLDKIDYVILNKKSELIVTNGKKIDDMELDYYEIYQLDSPEKMEIDTRYVMPKRAGEVKTLDSRQLYTQHKIDEEGNFLSTHKGDALTYGPYMDITEGVYQLEIQYDLIQEEDDKIMILSIKAGADSEEIIGDTIFANDKGEYKIEFHVEKNFHNTEIVLTPYFEGVKVTNIKLYKLD